MENIHFRLFEGFKLPLGVILWVDGVCTLWWTEDLKIGS